MSQWLFRLGLWTIVAVFASYVLRETFEGSSLAQAVGPDLLQKAGLAGLILLAASWVAHLIERVLSKRKKRCALCRTAIPRSEIYCRQHLREIRDQELEAARRMKLR